MPEEIAAGIYRIPVPLVGNPLKELNAYLLKGEDGNLLIDTGFRQPACREALFAGLRELGIRRGETEVLLTHLHSDHSGLAPEAAGEQTIYISEVDRLSLDDRAYRDRYWNTMEERFREEGFPRHLMANMNETNPARSMAPPAGGHYLGLADGQILEKGGCRIQCLLMPGHTPGQMCYWLPERGILFTGDHVLFDITPNITFWPVLPDALGSYLESLKKIRVFEPELTLPGHRKSGNLKTRVDQLLCHHQRRLEEALNVVKAHPGRGAYELAGHMTWKIRASSWADFPVAQKWFAVGECMSHLDHLTALGQIRREAADGKAVYYAI
ncbi:MBL fold metallo-hydrolase [Intestinimonas timonensis]|uniref:MBL fold metallo-hydrolase n=1 Tax=Intestinimonas timonensis TaxID=1689270 RepID=UPI001030FD3B|nr:MBL fold metallo-hydrolase [Intestinimonas timonensis]